MICILPEARLWPLLVEMVWDKEIAVHQRKKRSGLYTCYIHFKAPAMKAMKAAKSPVFVRVLGVFPS